MSTDQPPPPLTESEQKFVQFVIMQAQQILYVLGAPTPEGEPGQPNLEAAKMLIDQLELIQDKTKGNLTEQETTIMKEALSRVQLAFVQASGGTPASMMPERPMPEPDLAEGMGSAPEPEPEPTPAPAEPKPEPTPAPVAQPTPEPKADPTPAPAAEAESKSPDASEEENKKRFVKKYG